MNYLVYGVILQFVLNVDCILVIDGFSQKSLNLSDYCPKMEFCGEGMHVMCVYYNPNSVMGPLCHQSKKLAITLKRGNHILDVINAMRSRVALGLETGKNDKFLPRAYGLHRLVWDHELAAFAQLTANQCVVKKDFCRATKKFPNPGQVGGGSKFTHPDWKPLGKGSNLTYRGYNAAKADFAVTEVLKSWYLQKGFVTTEMVMKYPEFKTNSDGVHYLDILNGENTHIGCGISSTVDYTYHNDKTTPLNTNTVFINCNLSAQPLKGAALYNTTPPKGTSSKCGCPEHISQEDEDCLCIKGEFLTEPLKEKELSCPPNDPNCKPTVVLLPIFTFEDAPPSRHAGRQRHADFAINEALRRGKRGTHTDIHKNIHNRGIIKQRFEQEIDHHMRPPVDDMQMRS